jgi:hypothetical protein
MVTYDGSIGVSTLAFIDPESSQPFLQWNDLTFNGLALHVEPTTVKVKEISLIKPALVLSIDPDGISNMKRLLAPPGQVDASPKEKKELATEETSSPPLPVQVETV